MYWSPDIILLFFLVWECKCPQMLPWTSSGYFSCQPPSKIVRKYPSESMREYSRNRKICGRWVDIHHRRHFSPECSGIFLLLWTCLTRTMSCCVLHTWTAYSRKGPGNSVHVWKLLNFLHLCVRFRTFCFTPHSTDKVYCSRRDMCLDPSYRIQNSFTSVNISCFYNTETIDSRKTNLHKGTINQIPFTFTYLLKVHLFSVPK